MNLTTEMTLDGLVRALRWRLHDLAEGAERGYDRNRAGSTTEAPVRRQAPGRVRGDDDDRGGR